METTNEITMVEAEIVDTKLISEYVATFNSFQRKSAEAVIEMGIIVHQAKQLSKQAFAEFCNGIRYERTSKSLVKFKLIGEKGEMLRQYIDFLPNTWTAIYTLTALSDEEMQRVAGEGKLRPDMQVADVQHLVAVVKGKDISSLGNKAASAKSGANDEGYRFTLRFNTTPSADVVRVLQQIVNEYMRENGINADAELSRQLQDILDVVVETAAESEA